MSAFTDVADELQAEVYLLRALVDEAVKIQKENYGNGATLHMDMIAWSAKARAALSRVKG